METPKAVLIVSFAVVGTVCLVCVIRESYYHDLHGGIPAMGKVENGDYYVGGGRRGHNRVTKEVWNEGVSLHLWMMVSGAITLLLLFPILVIAHAERSGRDALVTRTKGSTRDAGSGKVP